MSAYDPQRTRTNSERGRIYWETENPHCFHLDLLRHPGGVLCVGLRYGAAIHGLVLQRVSDTGCAEVEDMRRLGLLGSVFRRDPVHDILTSGVFLNRRGHRGGVRGDLLRLGGDVGEQAVVGCPALIWAAHVFMFSVYCSTRASA